MTTITTTGTPDPSKDPVPDYLPEKFHLDTGDSNEIHLTVNLDAKTLGMNELLRVFYIALDQEQIGNAEAIAREIKSRIDRLVVSTVSYIESAYDENFHAQLELDDIDELDDDDELDDEDEDDDDDDEDDDDEDDDDEDDDDEDDA